MSGVSPMENTAFDEVSCDTSKSLSRQKPCFSMAYMRSSSMVLSFRQLPTTGNRRGEHFFQYFGSRCQMYSRPEASLREISWAPVESMTAVILESLIVISMVYSSFLDIVCSCSAADVFSEQGAQLSRFAR